MKLPVLASLLLLLPLGVQAQDETGPLGLAVAQAPEAGVGTCHGAEATAAMACAQAACANASGLPAADCVVGLWAYPANWSADLFMQHAEGPHWHEVLAGWSSREKLEQAVALKCAEDYLVECTIVRIWDPKGEKVLKADQSVAARAPRSVR